MVCNLNSAICLWNYISQRSVAYLAPTAWRLAAANVFIISSSFRGTVRVQNNCLRLTKKTCWRWYNPNRRQFFCWLPQQSVVLRLFPPDCLIMNCDACGVYAVHNKHMWCPLMRLSPLLNYGGRIVQVRNILLELRWMLCKRPFHLVKRPDYNSS